MLPSSLARAALCAALSLVSFAVPAADVSIVPAASAVMIDCNRMIIPDKSALSVEVRRNQSTGRYLYRYTVQSSDPSSPAVHDVLFKDAADHRRTSALGDGALTLESTAPPGIVRYSLIGEMQSGLTDADLQRLAQRFGGDRQQMLASVETAMSDSCPFARTLDVFDRGMTGTIVGPSDTQMLDTAYSGPAPPDSTDREVEMRTEELDPATIVVTDSLLQPVQVGPSALERRKDGTPVVRFTLDTASGTCNARGVLVRARMCDGTPVAGSVDVEPAACPSHVDQALLVLPPAS